ncbi:MAG: hypothetical protein ACREDR_02330, partial [Blastocatellia bacterium]
MKIDKVISDTTGSTEPRCEEFQSAITDFARGERSVTSAHKDAMAHIAECYKCERFLTDSRKMSRWLGSLAAVDRELEAPARIELQVLSAFRSGSAVRKSGWMQRTGLQSLELRKVAGIAAAVVLVIAATVFA